MLAGRSRVSFKCVLKDLRSCREVGGGTVAGKFSHPNLEKWFDSMQDL